MKEERYTFEELCEVVEILRSPGGCPWDSSQTHASMKECLVNECNEVIEAIDNKDSDNLCEELGDVLFQVLIHSQIAKEEGEFQLEDVIDTITRKMIRRHPKVFRDTDCPATTWAEIKEWEKEQRRKDKKMRKNP